MPVCTTCHLLKDPKEFAKEPKKLNGLRSNCNSCKNKQSREYKKGRRKSDRAYAEKVNKYLRDFLKKNPDKAKKYYKTKTKEQHLRYMLNQNYKITLEDYNKMSEKQGGVCKICGCRDVRIDRDGKSRIQRLAVDHCHKSGKIRGLLCSGCNGGLGLLRDDVYILKKALDYLTEATKEA